MLFQIHGLHANKNNRILRRYGIWRLPPERKSWVGEDCVLMWNGPGSWLLESEDMTAELILAELRKLFRKTDVTVTDLTAARFIVRVIGSATRLFLKKGCPIDVDSMQKNDVVTTLIGHLGVTIHCRGDEFDLYVLQSFGEDFWEWCKRSTKEFIV